MSHPSNKALPASFWAPSGRYSAWVGSYPPYSSWIRPGHDGTDVHGAQLKSISTSTQTIKADDEHQLLPCPYACMLRHRRTQGPSSGLALVSSLRHVLCHMPQALKLPVTLKQQGGIIMHQVNCLCSLSSLLWLPDWSVLMDSGTIWLRLVLAGRVQPCL